MELLGHRATTYTSWCGGVGVGHNQTHTQYTGLWSQPGSCNVVLSLFTAQLWHQDSNNNTGGKYKDECLL